MSNAEDQSVTYHSWSNRFARWTVRNRGLVGTMLIVATLFFLYPIVNAILTAGGHPLPGPIVRIDASARAQWPDHPFIHAQDQFASKFGTSSLVAIAVTVKEGTIFNQETLEQIDYITKAVDGFGYESHTKEREALRTKLEKEGLLSSDAILRALDIAYPPYPVNHYQVHSVTHSGTRVIQIEADGSITSEVLMKESPKTDDEVANLRQKVLQNPPFIYGRLVSLDEKGALISAGFITDRLNNRETYQAVFRHIQDVKAKVEKEHPNIQLYVAGEPIAVGWIIKHAFEIGVYVIATVLAIFVLLLAYFRRLHGVLIPFIAAWVTVIWGLGFTGWVKITFDPLVLVIPMIITARAVSHTVQMAERFFEDYEVILPKMGNDPEKAKIEAAAVAMGELIVPGTLGIVTDFLGLLVILITSIPQMRDLAIFGSFWVFAILFTVELLHPIMICYLPPPHDSKHYLPSFMVRAMDKLGHFVTDRKGKWIILWVSSAILVISTVITFKYSTIGDAKPGTPLLWPDHEFNVAMDEIAKRFGGVDELVIYASGDRANASADNVPIRAMEEFERWMEMHTDLGASISILPMLRLYWQMNHYGDPKWQFVPNDSSTVRGMIFQLRQSGPPGFLRPYITDEGQHANLRFFYPDHRGETIITTVAAAQKFIEDHPMGELSVRLDKDRAQAGAGFFDREKIADNFYYMLGPLLPPRDHTLHIRVRDEASGEYKLQPIQRASKDGLPEWIDEFHTKAIEDYANTKKNWPVGEYFFWPTSLADWDKSDVSQWYESKELGLRAVAVNTQDLIVQDMRSVVSKPEYQPTQSWTRGVQFVMAGGMMGIIAAINDEVERGHIANISLILLVIYILQSFTYRSSWSGAIIILQLSLATMVSFAYMALKGVGLNINTLPVQSVGLGIGVDYAIYIADRILEEYHSHGDIDEAVRRSISTTGMAVSFTASTIVGGIALWSFSSLRFQAEMAQLLVILMVLNMIGAITVVPAFFSIVRPKLRTAVKSAEGQAQS